MNDVMVMYEKIEKVDTKLSYPFLPFISDSAKELVLGMQQRNCKRSFSCAQIFSEFLFSLSFLDIQTLFRMGKVLNYCLNVMIGMM